MIKLLVHHAPSMVLLVLAVLAFGSLSYATLPREANPDVKIPVVMVSTPYVGVSPSDVESLVTIPIENELAGIKDLKKMSSTSAEGAAVISLEFEPDVVIEDALQRVRDRVNRAKPKLPEDAEEPQVQEISLSDVPIMIVTIAGDADEESLKELAERLEEEATRIPGVLDTRISGGLTREIRVQIDPRRLASYGLSFDDVTNAIRDENVNVPGGDVVAGDATFLLRVPGEFKSSEEIEGVAVKRVGDRPVFVRDLGRVVDGFADRSSYARMNGQRAVSLSITKRSGASIIDIADEVKSLAEAHQATWPDGVTYRVLADQSKVIRFMVADLENNIITALILVVGVIFFFMGARSSLFVAVAIPLSMLMSMVVIQAFGLTLNMIVLFSLILALGMLVDNAIVIVENVYRHLEEGKSVRQASIDGTQEVALAVAASTATTVAAFFPLVFWTGIMGEFMGYMPKTIIIVLISSLVVAVAILPVATSRLLSAKKEAPPTDKGAADLDAPATGLMGAYKHVLELSIKHRYISAGSGVASFVITFIAYGFLNHGTEFFASTEPARATISVRAPDGTDLESTDRIMRRIEAVLDATENVDVYVAESGIAGGGSPFGGSQAQPNQARITVDFLPSRNDAKEGEKVRVDNTSNTVDQLRAAVAQIPGAVIKIDKERMGPPVGKPIAVEVSGDDFHEVGAFAARVRRDLRGIDGATDLSDDYRVGRPEMRLRINRGAAKRVGASTAKVANTVRTAIAGSKASALRDGSDEYDIRVELDPRFRENLQDVLSLRFPGRLDTSPKTFQVPLSAVASYEMTGGSGSIRHIDQDLVVTIEGDVAEGYNENDVRNAVVAYIANAKATGDLPPGMDIRLGGANDEQADAQAFLGRAFLIAVMLIAVVLVTQFNNFRLPFIILATVALSLVGVLWGLILTGTPFGVIMTGLGVISLAGVVVNNAIVLLDYVEQLRAEGADPHTALVRAGMTRFRPVMLTAITTILGLVPMAIGISVDFRNMKLLIGGQSAEWWGPMAVAVIFGLAFATILTLVLVPTLYSIFLDIDRVIASRRGAPRATTAASTALGLLAVAGLGVASLPGNAAPVTLEQAWRAAEGHDISLAIAHEQSIQAETLKPKALSLLSPKLTAEASYTINENEIAFDMSDSMTPMFQSLADGFDASFGEGAGDEFRNLEVDSDPMVIQSKTAKAGSVSVVQPLFNMSSLPAFRGANRTIDAARAQERRARQQLRGGVSRAFYALTIARQAEQLAQKAVETTESHLELAERQVNAGVLPPRARTQARLGVAQARRELATSVENREQAGRAFSRVTGLPPDAELAEPPSPVRPASLQEARAAAVDRGDVQAARDRATAAKHAKVAEQMGWLPTLSGRFTYAYNENTGFSDDTNTWMVVFSANWTAWDGGYRIAQTKERASQARVADLSVQRALQDVDEELSSAWQRLQQAEHAVSAASDEVQLADENLAMAEAAARTGSGTWLEVQDARLAQHQATLGQLNARAGRDLATIDLKLAMGQY